MSVPPLNQPSGNYDSLQVNKLKIGDTLVSINNATDGETLTFDNGLLVNSAGLRSGIIKITNVTSSGQFVFQTGTKSIEVKVWGGGGAGGGAVAGSNVSIGAPGGSGAFIHCFGSLPEGVCTIDIGVGGTQVSGGQGGSGGASTVTWTGGSFVSANGGYGGNSVGSLTNLAGLTQPVIGYNYLQAGRLCSSDFTEIAGRDGNMSELSIVYVGTGMSVRPRNRSPEISPSSFTTYNSLPVALSGEGASDNSGEGGAGGINTNGTIETPGGNGGSGFVQIIEYW